MTCTRRGPPGRHWHCPHATRPTGASRASAFPPTAAAGVAEGMLGDRTVDLAAKRVMRRQDDTHERDGNGDVRLTPTEWHLLEVLLRNPGKLLSQQQLLAEVWGPGYADATGNLRLYMAQRLRKLDPDPTTPRWLRTEPGMGYR